MECPFLKKISFKKVNRIASDQTDGFDTNEPEPLDEQEFDFEEDSVETINSSKVNPHQIYYFNSKINPPERSNQHLNIKFPKQFETKKMSSYTPASDLDENVSDDSISSEGALGASKSVPHVLVSKMSMLNAKSQDIFQGEVTLEGEEGLFKCELKDRAIKIFKQDKVKLFIEMEKAQATFDDIKQTRGRLWATCKNKTVGIYVKFGSVEQMMCFSKALQLNYFDIALSQEKADQQSLSYSMDSLGFEVERMPTQRLLQIGDTFDLILFKNKNLMSRVQRLFTNSDYDHVAMILRASNQEMFMLESTSNAGVAVYTLQSLVNLPKKKYYIRYVLLLCRVGYRRYRGERKVSEVYKLQEFIKGSLGKKYKFDPMYLISSDAKKEDTFFCSELVASALQRAGLMDKAHQPYKFLPKHFADQTLNESIVSGSYAQTVVLQ